MISGANLHQVQFCFKAKSLQYEHGECRGAGRVEFELVLVNW